MSHSPFGVEVEDDEHVIKCNICGRGLIIKDNINNGVAFLSHLKDDHGIFYTAQRSIAVKRKPGRKESDSEQMLEPPK